VLLLNEILFSSSFLVTHIMTAASSSKRQNSAVIAAFAAVAIIVVVMIDSVTRQTLTTNHSNDTTHLSRATTPFSTLLSPTADQHDSALTRWWPFHRHHHHHSSDSTNDDSHHHEMIIEHLAATLHATMVQDPQTLTIVESAYLEDILVNTYNQVYTDQEALSSRLQTGAWESDVVLTTVRSDAPHSFLRGSSSLSSFLSTDAVVPNLEPPPLRHGYYRFILDRSCPTCVSPDVVVSSSSSSSTNTSLPPHKQDDKASPLLATAFTHRASMAVTTDPASLDPWQAAVCEVLATSPHVRFRQTHDCRLTWGKTLSATTTHGTME
jgi:hypothetical protein